LAWVSVAVAAHAGAGNRGEALRAYERCRRHLAEELGVNPGNTGSPLAAAASSFGSFALGALVPLLPWFVASGSHAVLASIVLGTLAAVATGAAVGYFTSRPMWKAALRQLLIAAMAAAITYGVGKAIGMRAA